MDEDDELQVAEWDQAAADTAYREQVGPRNNSSTMSTPTLTASPLPSPTRGAHTVGLHAPNLAP